MRRYFSTYEVEIVEKEIEIDGLKSSQTAKLYLFDDKGNTVEERELIYIKAEEIYEKIANEEIINLDNCYVKDFSLSTYRNKKGVLNDTYIILKNFSAKDAFFDASSLEMEIDFSFAFFDNQIISFENTQFVNAPVDFTYSNWEKGVAVFSYCLFENGTVNFSNTNFGRGDVIFKNSVFRDGNKNFQNVNFGRGFVGFINTEFNAGDVSFANSDFGVGRTSFKIARFGKGKVDFHYAIFGNGEVTFERTEFGDGSVNFRSARFAYGKKDFTRANFGKGQVSFVNTNFGKGNVSFVNSHFKDGKVSFKLALFSNGKTDFHYASFGKGDLSFERTEFGNGSVDFRAVEFGEGKLTFNRTNFGNGDSVFEASEKKGGRVTFKYSIFGNGSLIFDMAEYSTADIYFEHVNFGKGVSSFSRGKFKTLNINSCHFNNYIDLRVLECDTVDLTNTIIRDIVDMTPYNYKVDIKELELSGVRLLGRIYIDWHGNNVKKFILQQDKDYRHKAEQFRVLKENYNAIGQYSDEDEAYVEFKRAELKSNLEEALAKNKYNKFWAYPRYFFQWIIFDKVGLYATDPLRVFISMLFTYLFFSATYMVLSVFTDADIVSSLGDPDKLSQFEKVMYHSAITFLTIGYGDYYPSGVHRWISSIEGFTGLFLMSYFTVAFVRKILR